MPVESIRQGILWIAPIPIPVGQLGSFALHLYSPEGKLLSSSSDPLSVEQIVGFLASRHRHLSTRSIN